MKKLFFCLFFLTVALQAQSYVTIYLDTSKAYDSEGYVTFDFEFDTGSSYRNSKVWIDLNNNHKLDEGELAKFYSSEFFTQKGNIQKECRIYGEFTKLKIGGNGAIYKVDLSHCRTLKELSINFTKLKEVDISKLPNLVHCSFLFNQIKKITANNPLLKTLDIANNELTSLDLQKFPKLTELDCAHNKLKQLDLSKLPDLKVLVCRMNQLTKLELSNNKALEELYCNYNQLTHLDLNHNVALNVLMCSKNSLKSIDIQQNENLIDLDCESNYLTTLAFAKKNKITRLSIEHNSFKSDALSQLVAQLPTATRSKREKEPTYDDLVADRDEVKNVILLHEHNPSESRVRSSLMDDAYQKQDEQIVRFSKQDEKTLQKKGWKIIYKELEPPYL